MQTTLKSINYVTCFKDYVGYTIKEAVSVTKNNIVTYHVVIVKDATTMTLVYDKDGVFVKKLPPTPEKK
jgi:hypothetical protein